jgi:hypothetical protein
VTECKGAGRMGRRPQGVAALTGAERQARNRLRLGLVPDQAPGPAVPRPVSLQADYARWLDALPEATRDTATGEALQAIVDLDLEDIIAIQPPRSFGRD